MIYTIYFIDQSVAAEFANRSPTLEEKLFFSDLATSFQHGYCYLCGDSASLKYLYANQDGIVGSIYNTVRSHYSESGAAINAVQQVFVLTYQNKPDMSSLPEILENKCYFIYIPTAISSNWRLHAECCLLTENLEDGEFYLFMAKHYCQERNIPYQRIRFHRENGGGNTICNVLEKCVLNDKVPVLCLVDSDRKYGATKSYPNPPAIGDTLDRAQKASQKLLEKEDLPPHVLLPLHVHEVENLIPFQLLEELEQGEHLGMQAGLSRIAQLRQINNGEPLLYYDYKKGFPYIVNISQRAYWKERLIELGGSDASMPSADKLERGSYKPDTLFFPPLNNKILQHILKKIKKMEQENKLITIELDNYLKDIWNDVGMQLLTWGYTHEPLRA